MTGKIEVTNNRFTLSGSEPDSVFQAISASLPLALFVTNEQGALLYCNDRFVSIAGITPAPIDRQLNVEKILGKEVLGEWQSKVGVDREVITAAHTNGFNEIRHLEIEVRPMVDRPNLFLWVCNDVTEKKLVGDILQRRTLDLDERMRELFCLYRISNLNQRQTIGLNEFLAGAAEIIAESWRHPELSCARISVGGAIYETEAFNAGQLRSSESIVCGGEEIGAMEVFYRSELNDPDDEKYSSYDRTLIQAVATTIGRFVEKHRTEEALREANEQLATEGRALEEKNTALKEILSQIGEEKKAITRQVQSNVERIVMPILNRLDSQVGERDAGYVKLLRNSLNEIVSSFGASLRSKFSTLTPREIEICNMLKNDLSCKEIARLNHTSVHTVLKQRQRIRRKLGINGTDINLASFLENL